MKVKKTRSSLILKAERFPKANPKFSAKRGEVFEGGQA
jgi:hypothetical protein